MKYAGYALLIAAGNLPGHGEFSVASLALTAAAVALVFEAIAKEPTP